MQYQIIHHQVASMLQAAVKQALREGWKVKGGVSVGSGVFAQAMVRPPKRKAVAK